MKQVFLNKGAATVEEFPQPQVSDRSILVAVSYSFISTGTEGATVAASTQDAFVKRLITRAPKYIVKVAQAVREHGVSGTVSLVKGKLKQLLALGYSCSGQIVSVGKNVTTFKVGDYVACAGAGIASHAEFVAVPENLAVRLSGEKILKQASITTIGSIAMQGVRRADLRLGETVCVIGLGLIGQITAQLLKRSGCSVIGVDIVPERLKIARSLGIDFAFDPSECSLKREIDFITQHYGVDATIITAGSQTGEIIDQSMDVTRRRGKVVLVGDVKIDFDRAVFYKKEIDFLISCSYGPGRYDSSYEQKGVDYPYAYVRWTENRNMQLFVKMLDRKEIMIDPLISSEFELERAGEAYDYLKNKKPLGIVLSYSPQEINGDDDDEEAISVPIELTSYKVPDGVIKVGMVGFGGFSKVKLFPILSTCPGVRVDAFVDVDPANAINSANQNRASLVTNSYQELLSNDDINMAVIATPHALHARQTIDFLKAGKAVFSEKPAVCTWSELDELKSLFKHDNNFLYAVDFNRSFAPFVTAIKDVVTKRSNPLIVTYRMNAGFIPQDHWIQEQGGRVIGEACHIFELFAFLVDSKPVSVSVEVAHPNSDDLTSSDNFSTHIRFSDGSLCSLVYTAFGNKELNKERMEVFFDGKSIVMDDYRKLTGYGLPVSFNKSSIEQDKGHSALLKQFAIAARTQGGVSPISFERILRATELSLIIDELARKGGGMRDLTISQEKVHLDTSEVSEEIVEQEAQEERSII
jgi:predicted dehydrogenase/threonine dehydrogenase-like Zn-dependent dehydrogenase